MTAKPRRLTGTGSKPKIATVSWVVGSVACGGAGASAPDLRDASLGAADVAEGGWGIGDADASLPNDDGAFGVAGDGDGLEWGSVILDDAIAVSGQGSDSCHVAGSGRVLCHGANDQGQLGNGLRQGVNTANTSTTVDNEVVGIDDALDVLAVSRTARCALTGSGSLSCWGLVAERSQLLPVAVAPPSGAGRARVMRGVESAVLYGGIMVDAVFLLTDAGQLCTVPIWGGWETDCTRVVAKATSFAATPRARYVVDADGAVFSCSVDTRDATCTQLELPTGAVDVAALEYRQVPLGLALLDDGRVACWGACPLNDPSDLTFVPESAPVTVPGLDHVARFVSPTCTIDHDDVVRCWGSGVRKGDRVFYTRPERVGTLPELARLVDVDFNGVPLTGLTTSGKLRALRWP